MFRYLVLVVFVCRTYAQVMPGTSSLNGLSSGSSAGSGASAGGLDIFPDVSGTQTGNLPGVQSFPQPDGVSILNPDVLGSQPGGLKDEMPGPLTLTGGINTDQLAGEEAEGAVEEAGPVVEEAEAVVEEEVVPPVVEEEVAPPVVEEGEIPLVEEEEIMQEALEIITAEGLCADELRACEIIATCDNVLKRTSVCKIPQDIIQGADVCWQMTGFSFASTGFQAFSDLATCISDHSFETLDDPNLDICSGDFVCSEIFLPVCATNGDTAEQFDNECFLDLAACDNSDLKLLHKDECTEEDIEGIDVCGEEMFCMTVFDPVCAFTEDGTETFPNACELRQAQCDDPDLSLKHDGECSIEAGDNDAAADLADEINQHPWVLVLVLVGLVILTCAIGFAWRKYNDTKGTRAYATLDGEGAEMVSVDFD